MANHEQHSDDLTPEQRAFFDKIENEEPYAGNLQDLAQAAERGNPDALEGNVFGHMIAAYPFLGEEYNNLFPDTISPKQRDDASQNS